MLEAGDGASSQSRLQGLACMRCGSFSSRGFSQRWGVVSKALIIAERNGPTKLMLFGMLKAVE